ncbi:MAG: hypothetical protein Fur0010_24880 [Bdellovibrio sp.]
MAQPNDKNDSMSIYRVLVNAKEASVPLLLWHEEGEHFYKIPLKIMAVDREKSRIEVQVQFEHLDTIEKLWSLKSIRFYLSNGSYFFSAYFEKLLESGKLYLSFPLHLKFFDRRNTPRFHPEKLIKVEIVKEGLKFYKNCYDFSRGGFSIVFSKSENSAFTLGERIPQANIHYDEEVYHFPVIVQEITSIKPFVFENIPYGHRKISFQFSKLNSEQKKDLALIIGHHMGIFPVED